MKKILSLIFILCVSCSVEQSAVSNGIDIFFKGDLSIYQDKKIGLVMNHTSISKDGQSLFNLSKSSLDVVAIFTPEHGLFGKNEAGEVVNSDEVDGIPMHSLYGKNKRPSSDQLKGIDVLLFDMQDIGSRYYTYISTLTYVMESAAENNIELIVLDRANPMGDTIQGPLLSDEFESFVGMHPVPIRHGLTIGEFAVLIKQMGWIENAGNLNLDVIKIEGWNGGYTELQLPPSPNIPNLETAVIYNGLCLLEGTNLSEGRGTDNPFKIFGAPWLDTEKIIEIINSQHLDGVILDTVSFTPKSIPEKSVYPKYKDIPCNGILIHITNRNTFFPLKFGVAILKAVHDTHPEEFMISGNGFLSKLYGSDELVENIFNGSSIDELVLTWKDESSKFKKMTKPFRLYQK